MIFKPEDVIYSYTDEQALEDGVLVSVRGLAPFPINRVTRALWEHFTRPIGNMPLALGGSPVTDTTMLSRLGDAVGAKIKAGDLQEGWVIMEFEGKKIWALPNETIYNPTKPPYDKQGWTIMFPEDY